jgi:hypothetical protein
MLSNAIHGGRSFILLTLLLVITPWLMFGQASFEAQVRGVVRDSSGSVIVGARVTITDMATNISNVTATDERGSYIFNGLHPATYTIKAEASGFRAEETKDVKLDVSQHTSVDFTLQVAGLENSVTVVEAAPMLETGDSALGTTVTGQYTRDMPLYGRSYFGLVFLAPGITESAGSGIRDNYPSGTNFVSNGQRNSTAEIRFDGAPVTAPEQGEGGNTNVYYTPSVEVIGEFKVENNSFSAEYGNNGGTVINIMMKQGGNQIHGSGWYFGQRDALDANDFFSNQAGIGKPPKTHDQYGGLISGPIKKNKIFYLFDFERQTDNTSGQTIATFPTALQRAGNFSQTMTYDANGNLAPVVIYNPLTISKSGIRQPFPNNTIPKSMLDPVALALEAYMPLPNVTGAAGTDYNNYVKNVPTNFRQYQLDGRVDYQINDKNRLGARYSYLNNVAPTAVQFVDDSYTYSQQSDNAVLEYDWTINPRILYTGRIGVDFVHAPGVTDYPSLTKVGFPSYLINGGLDRMPSIEFGNAYTNIFDQCCVDTHFTHTLITYSSALSWVKGAHSLKFGGEQRVFFNNFWQPSNPTGLFSFDQNATNMSPNDGVVTEGDSFASLLLGWGSNGFLQEISAVADKSKETGFYVQDDWRVNSKLTVNLGLRYEWSTPYSERYNRSTFSDFTDPSGVTVPGVGPIRGITIFPTSGNRNIPVDRNNVGPRLGLAYSWDSKTVIRAGAGVYYGMNIATNFQYPGPAFESSPNVYYTNDNYQTQFATLDNPFPVGIPAPQGTKYGKLAMWGYSNGSDLSYETANNADIYQWSAGIQRELPGDSVIEVDYSANRSTHLPWGGFAASTRNRNFIPTNVEEHYTSDQLATPVANPFLPFFVGPNAIFNEPASRYSNPTIPLGNLLSPYPQFDGEFDGLPLLAALSRYDAMQLKFEKKSSKYVTFQGSYTLARATDNSSSGANSWVGWLGSGGPQALDRLSEEYSVSANNATNRVAAAFTTNLPVGRGLMIGNNMNPILDKIIGGWSASSNLTLQSGQPVHIGMHLSRLANGSQRPNVSCTDPSAGISPHAAAAALLNGATSGISMFNASCFSDPGDQQLGNAPRYFDNLTSQGIENLDIGLRKEFRIHESHRLQLRMEAFNALNRTRFNRAGYRFGSGSFGQVTGLAPGFFARQMQFVARYEF